MLPWCTGARLRAEAPSVAPRNVRHTASSPAHLRVEWDDAATDEPGYRIWRRKVDGDWYLAGQVPAKATHFDDGGMQERTAYEHKVAAFNDDGEGPTATTSAATETAAMVSHLKPEIIFRADGVQFAKAPSAVELKSGELLLAFDIGDTATRRSRQDESLWLAKSQDGRSKWSSPQKLFHGDKETIFGKSALVRMTDGRLGLAFSRWQLDEKGKIIDRRRQFVASADEGETWSTAVDVGPLSANNNTLIVGENGRLLESLSDTVGKARVFASDDYGGTWRELATVLGRRLGEAALAHAGDGRVVYLSRHEWPFYRLAYSADNGESWSENPDLLYLGGGDNPPKLLKLNDGTLVAIVHSWYPGRKSKDRRQLASVVSRDGGRTWDNFRLIGYSPDGSDGFLQHSAILADGTVYLFYGGGSSRDTNDGEDLRLQRLAPEFFTSTAPWPYDWHGKPTRP